MGEMMMKRTVQFRADAILIDRLDNSCKDLGVNRSEVIRHLILDFTLEHERKNERFKETW